MTYNPEYYRRILDYRSDVFRKANKVLEEQEKNVSVAKKAVETQEVYSHQLKDAALSLHRDHQVLAQKNKQYKDYVMLLGKQQQKLAEKLNAKNRAISERELKFQEDFAKSTRDTDSAISQLDDLKEQYMDLQKQYETCKERRRQLATDYENAKRSTDNWMLKNNNVGSENKKLRHVLRLEKDAIGMVEKDEFRRLDQLSLIDPVYADHLRRRWYIDGSKRTLHDWELSRFGSLLPALSDPSLDGRQERRHYGDRLKIHDPENAKDPFGSPGRGLSYASLVKSTSPPMRAHGSKTTRTNRDVDRPLLNSPDSVR